MKYLDLFTGIGGFTYGIEKAFCNAHGGSVGKSEANPSRNEGQGLLTKEGEDSGTEERPTGERATNVAHERPLCIGYSEIDKYASAIYQSHYPTHHNYGDITKIDATTLPDFDLLVGGFPCQAFSIAGKRLGFDDTRGTLFFEVARILKEKQPRNFVLENVKGLLSHDGGRTFKTIISTLAELGYGVEWQVLNSKDFGVPQNRERVYIVGHLGGFSGSKVFPITEDGGQTDELPRHIANTLTRRYEGAQAVGTYIGEGELNAQETRPVVRIREATKKGYAEATVGQAINLSVPNSKTRRGRVSDVAQTLDTGMQQHTLTPQGGVRRLTPTECERLQGFPDGWTKMGIFCSAECQCTDSDGKIDGKHFQSCYAQVSDTQRYKCLGNAVTTNVVEAVIRRLFTQ